MCRVELETFEGFCHEILTDPMVGGQPNGARTVFVYFTEISSISL